MIKVDVEVEPLVFYASNEHAAVAEATKVILRSLIARTKAGRGPRGAMPRPRDGGPPMVESGTLINSFGMRVRLSARGVPTGIIVPEGNRPADEHSRVSEAKKSARATTRVMRSHALKHTSVGRLVGKERARALSRIRVRAVTDNASLAAVLANRDKFRPRRVVYNIWETTEQEDREAAAVIQRVLEVSL